MKPFIYVPPKPQLPAAPTPAPPLAADLRTLAGLVEANPELVEHLAATLERLTVVLPVTSTVNPREFANAVTSTGATRIAPTGPVEPWFSTRAWQLPAGTIRLALSHLSAERLAASLSGDELFASAS